MKKSEIPKPLEIDYVKVINCLNWMQHLKDGSEKMKCQNECGREADYGTPMNFYCMNCWFNADKLKLFGKEVNQK